MILYNKCKVRLYYEKKRVMFRLQSKKGQKKNGVVLSKTYNKSSLRFGCISLTRKIPPNYITVSSTK